MLDIKFIRENKDIVAAGAIKKHIKVDIDKLIALDDSVVSCRPQLMASERSKMSLPNRS